MLDWPASSAHRPGNEPTPTTAAIKELNLALIYYLRRLTPPARLMAGVTSCLISCPPQAVAVSALLRPLGTDAATAWSIIYIIILDLNSDDHDYLLTSRPCTCGLLLRGEPPYTQADKNSNAPSQPSQRPCATGARLTLTAVASCSSIPV